MAANRGLKHKIVRTYWIQALLIAAAALLGIYLTNWLLANVLVKQALAQEAEHFWQRFGADPDGARTASLNLRSYLLPRDAQQLPDYLHNLEPGYHTVQREGFNTYWVSQRHDRTLVLAFNRAQVDNLISLYGVVPLMIVLTVLYLVLWLTYRLARRAISPTIALAERVQQLDPLHPDKSVFAPQSLPPHTDADVASLAAAFSEFIDRLGAFVQREQQFTRDASHELRSPITVITMAAEMLNDDPALNVAQRALVDRIQRAAHDMQELTEALLALSREQRQGAGQDTVNINDLLREEIARLKVTVDRRPVELVLREHEDAIVAGHPRIVAILFGNLLRNAVNYTDSGEVSVEVYRDRVLVRDTGCGIGEEKLARIFEPYVREAGNRRSGYGVGLAIVKRLCDQFGWRIAIASEKGRGTEVEVMLCGDGSEGDAAQAT